MAGHLRYMQQALTEAEKGELFVAPNPMVGAVIVHKGKVLSTGYHARFGEPHAEVQAVQALNEEDHHLIPESIMYVTLEPCSHHGKTPPCCEMLVREGFRHIVVATKDPNPKVAGKGLAYLESHGVKVELGIAGEQAAELNKAFFTFHSKQRPYIVLKWAVSADGFLSGTGGELVHMTGPESDVIVHKLRAKYPAILVGAATAIGDDPLLTVRHVRGPDPLRVILSDGRPLPEDLRMYQDGGNVLVIEAPMSDWTDTLVHKMIELGLTGVLVEGGANTLELFLKAGLWDEIHRFNCPLNLGGGTPAPRLSLVPSKKEKVGEDLLEIFIG